MEDFSRQAQPVPVLFLVFNRPEETRRVFQVIRQARPARLYIASDGPREQSEDACVKALREALKASVDWPCETFLLFREKNLGCKFAVSGAIDWFFEHEEEGIILEDDCVPSLSFFSFCEELLERYRHDHRVSSIGGSSFFTYDIKSKESYFFSKYNPIWGWATWRRAWEQYDVTMRDWPALKSSKAHDSFFRTERERRYFEQIFDDCYHGKIDTWDYQWLYAKWKMKSVTCVASKNLIKNIGDGPRATHTTMLPQQVVSAPLLEMDFPLIHPKEFAVDVRRDMATEKFRYPTRWNTFKTCLKRGLQSVCSNIRVSQKGKQTNSKGQVSRDA